MIARHIAALFQFRFRTLFLWVAFVALATTALMNASAAWSHDLYFAGAVLLTLAIPLAWYRSGEKRAFWAGFALCGWIYFLIIGQVSDKPQIDWSDTASRGPSANIPTSRLTYWIYTRAYGEADDPSASLQASSNSSGQSIVLAKRYLLASGSSRQGASWNAAANPAGQPNPQWWHFLNVGHALWTILLAYFGGLIVRGIYILRPEEKP